MRLAEPCGPARNLRPDRRSPPDLSRAATFA